MNLLARAVLLGACACLSAVVPHALAGTKADAKLPLGVLGDSDSHAYADDIILRGTHLRGGTYRRTTYQWTEVLDRLRGHEIDQGAWGVWGNRGPIASLLDRLGLRSRAPRKRDYEFNFAFSGATCEQLHEGRARQTERLLDVMRRDTAYWSRGIVVIRIGINSIGTTDDFDDYAAHGLTPRSRERIDRCISHIERSITEIRKANAHTRIVVVGICDEANSIFKMPRWPRADQYVRITEVVDFIDARLQEVAAATTNATFFDDRAWLRSYWGGRKADGSADFRTVSLGGPESVRHTKGDHPANSVLADDHAGSVLNALWAKDLIALLNERFGFTLSPIGREEISKLVDPDGRFGLADVPKPEQRQ